MNTTFITALIMAAVTFFFVRSCYDEKDFKDGERGRNRVAAGYAAAIFVIVAAIRGLGLV